MMPVWPVITIIIVVWHFLQTVIPRQGSFIKPLMKEQWRHVYYVVNDVKCVGDGRNWTYAVLVRVWLDTAVSLANCAQPFIPKRSIVNRGSSHDRWWDLFRFHSNSERIFSIARWIGPSSLSSDSACSRATSAVIRPKKTRALPRI